MNVISIARIFSWLAAANTILAGIVLGLTPLADQSPYVAKVLVVVAMISGVITPFLPRAQGSK